ncbi:MAG: hypothetical protein FWC16_02640 [Defluviitaleaceae bacterium]|nr:hypothetical protein [Defluviitaleaceae bacterium]MCL2273797.1 hypothetical protein [Defluviitaleaceae bacterium]
MKNVIRWTSLRRLIIPVLVGLFNISLLLFPRDVLNAAREGLLLWFNTVLPSLLPFVVGMNILMLYGFLRLIGDIISPVIVKLFGIAGAGGVAFITGVASGYPLGAKTVGDLFRAGDISTEEAQRLLAFCNNAGPLFIVGAVGIGMFGDARAGYALLIGHLLGAIFTGVLLRKNGEKVKFIDFRSLMRAYTQNLKKKRDELRIGRILGEAVKNAMEAMLLVGGLIIFFNVLVRLLQMAAGIESGFFSGFFEITSGARLIANGGVSALTLAAAGGIIGFGGLSVHAQALHFTAGTGVKAVPYLLCKLMHGALAAGFTAVAWFAMM